MQDLLNKPVNPAWPLGARREIKLMSEDQILDVKGGSSWHLPAIVVLGLIALVGLAFGWSASSKLDSTQQAVATQLKQAQQSMQQDMSSLKDRLAQDEKANTDLQGDLKVVTDKLKIPLKIGIRLLILRQTVLQRGHILLHRLLGLLQLRCNCLLGAIQLGRSAPAEGQSN